MYAHVCLVKQKVDWHSTLLSAGYFLPHCKSETERWSNCGELTCSPLFILSFSRGRLRLGAPVEKGHSASMSRSWRLERSITIYMLIFDSSLLPDAHTLVQRYKTLVLWVLSRTERNLRMEELTSRSHSRMFIQPLRHFFMSQGEKNRFLSFFQYMFTWTVLETFLLVKFLTLQRHLNYENTS